MATTYLEFSGYIQVFVCIKLWCPEASRITTTQCLILQREILPHIVSGMAHPWHNLGLAWGTDYSPRPIPLNFDSTVLLILMILPRVEWFCPVIQPVFWKSSSSSSHIIFSPVCGNLLWLSATPISWGRASRSLLHKADGPFFLSFSTQYDFFQLRLNGKQNH